MTTISDLEEDSEVQINITAHNSLGSGTATIRISTDTTSEWLGTADISCT